MKYAGEYAVVACRFFVNKWLGTSLEWAPRNSEVIE